MFLRTQGHKLEQTAGVVGLKVSTLSEWNGLFDDRMNPLVIPDGRGKSGKVTAEIVRKVVDAAQQTLEEKKRIILNRFTRHLEKEREIQLSRKTVSDILIANDLYKVQVRKRRPGFYQQLRQTIPNGLISVDGSEFIVWLDGVGYPFNVETAIDVKSFYHSAYSVSESETSEEFIKVMEAHVADWGNPLAVVSDHGSANLSEQSKAWLKARDIEPLPAGPGNPKGNGTVEGAFSQLKQVIGQVRFETCDPHKLAKQILEKCIAIYVALRNRLSRSGDVVCPEQSMLSPVSQEKKEAQKKRYKKRRRKQTDPEAQKKLDLLSWLIRNHGWQIDDRSLKRAEKCIVFYDLKVIEKSEQAFLVAIRRNSQRNHIAYFFGILKNKQNGMDEQKYSDYCRRRYNYNHLLDKERTHKELAEEVTSEEDFADLIRQAVSVSELFVKNVCIRQSKSMAQELMNSNARCSRVRQNVADMISKMSDMDMTQQQEAFRLLDQLIT